MLIRRETPEDIDTIRSVTAQAFTGLPHSLPPLEADVVPGEATLVGRGDYFQVRTLAAYDASLTGTFRYAAPFETIG